jgi:integrase
MAKPLTPIAIANLKPKPKRYEVSDGGCQGLRVVIFPTGRKSFILRYRFRGLQRKLTLGERLAERGVAEHITTPQTDTPLSLLAARELATKALREAKAGHDPAVAKEKKRDEERAAESDTLQAISAEFLRRVGPGLRTLDQRRSDLELLCAPLGRLPVGEIKRGQYVRVLDNIADTRGLVRADRVLASLKRLLSWHAERSDFISPLGRGGRRSSPRERARSRVLSDDELRAVWHAARQDKGAFGAFLCFTLLTATRRNEAGGLRRSELTDDGRTWIIPGARYKSKRDTMIPLSAKAQAIITAQPQRAGDFVFSADGSRALGDFASRKIRFDAACGVSDWRIHDLRRTSRTLLSRAGIPADIAEMCLGHALGGIRGTYDRHEYQDEKKAAFEALAQLIVRIVRPPQATVADMATERLKRQPSRD